MIRPTLSEAKEYAKQGYHMVPVCYEMLSDIITPINLLKKLKAENEHCYILESVENQELWGRYTFLGYSPKLDITCMNGTLTLKDENGAVIKETSGIHPEIFIREVLKDYKSPKIEGFPTFTGGLVGYFSYDYLKYSEKKLVLDAKDEEGFQDVDLMLFDKVIAFDNVRSKLILIANAGTASIEEGYQKALQDIKEMKELILHGAEADIPAPVLKTEFKPLFDKEAYCRMVEKAKHYIYEGDIFQVVLSNRLEAEMEGSLFDTYRLLRSTNPSPYMFYFDGDTIEVAGASPETLVKVEDGVLHTFPLAGTRPRGKTKVEDLELEKSLMADEKELAEHNMLVDLGEMISEKSVSLERSKSNDTCPSSVIHTLCISALPYAEHSVRIWMQSPLSMRFFRPEPYPVHRRSGHVRSSTSLKITNGVFTAARSVISISQEIWIPASRSESHTARGIKYLSVPVPAL